MALGDMPSGDCNQTGNTRLRSQQVVIVSVQPAQLKVIANMEYLPVVIKKKAKIHFMDHLLALLMQILKTNPKRFGCHAS